MTLRQLLLAWILGPFALGIALLCAAWYAPEPERRFDGAEVAVIGSSLSVYAMPERLRLSNGRSLRRVGLSTPTEYDLLFLFEKAIDERAAGQILLEALPFVADFAFDQTKGCHAPARRLREELHGAQVLVVDRLRRLSGRRTRLEGISEPHRLDRAQKIDPTVMATFYPLTIHPPCQAERLERAVAKAKAQGIRVTLVAYPRSPYGQARLGSQQERELTQATRQLAARLGLDLMVPTADWSNTEFVDHAHLNSRGRARFVRELGSWLEHGR
jgi:hypothetical protein